MAAPRTVWRIRLQNGSVVHCVLWERKPETAEVWYRDDEVQGVEEFEDPVEAEDWAASLSARVPIDCYGPFLLGHRLGVPPAPARVKALVQPPIQSWVQEWILR